MAPTENQHAGNSTIGEPMQVESVPQPQSNLVDNVPSRIDTTQTPDIETPSIPSSGSPGTVQVRYRMSQVQINRTKSFTRE
jgi:hypothetical protein